MNFQMFKLVLEKAEESEIKLPTFVGWIIEKTREFQKKSTCFLDDAKAFVWITTNCGTNWFLYCIINNDSANIYE